MSEGGSFDISLTIPFQVVGVVKLKKETYPPRFPLRPFTGYELFLGHLYGWKRSDNVRRMRRQYRARHR